MFLLLAPAFSYLSLEISFDKVIYIPGEVGRADVVITSPSDMPAFIQYYVNGEQFILSTRELKKGRNELPLYFKVPSEEGFYDFKVEVRGKDHGITKAEYFTVSSPDKGFLVDLEPDVLIVKERGTLTLKVANIGNYDDVFEILPPKYLSEFNYSYVEVPKREIVELNLSFDPDDLKGGSYDYNLKVCSLSLWRCEEVHSQVIVEREESEESEFEFLETLFGTPNSRIPWKVKVRNKSNFNKTYTFSLEQLNFSGTFESFKIVEVPPGEAEVSLDIYPNETGNFYFSYQISSNGVRVREGMLNLTIKTPFLSPAFLLSPKLGWIYFVFSLLVLSSIAFLLLRKKVTYPYAK